MIAKKCDKHIKTKKEEKESSSVIKISILIIFCVHFLIYYRKLEIKNKGKIIVFLETRNFNFN